MDRLLWTVAVCTATAPRISIPTTYGPCAADSAEHRVIQPFAFPDRSDNLLGYDTGDVISCTGTGQDGDIQAGVAWPSPRFTDNSDGTVTDNLTGLMWTQNANPAGNYTDWQSALDYVQTLNTGGHTDWRLPDVIELESLINDDEPDSVAWLNSQSFTQVQCCVGCGYWSSTTNANDPGGAWFVDMGDCSVDNDDKSGGDGDYYAWPVRGGPVGGSSGTSTISPATTTTSQTETTTTRALPQQLSPNYAQQKQFTAGIVRKPSCCVSIGIRY